MGPKNLDFVLFFGILLLKYLTVLDMWRFFRRPQIVFRLR